VPGQFIIALSAKKQGGKNTAAKVIPGVAATALGVVGSDFPVLDRERLPDGFWKEFSFADPLKEFCMDVLGLSCESCYGSDEEKNAPTHIMWEDMPGPIRWKLSGSQYIDAALNVCHYEYRSREDHALKFYTTATPCNLKEGPMSGREVMQVFGTELIRENFGSVWARSAIRKIKKSPSRVNLITDCRFPDEVEAVLHEPLGYVLRLTRNPCASDIHKSETALDDFNWNRDRCILLDNSQMSIDEQHAAVIPIMDEIFRRNRDEFDAGELSAVGQEIPA